LPVPYLSLTCPLPVPYLSLTRPLPVLTLAYPCLPVRSPRVPRPDPDRRARRYRVVRRLSRSSRHHATCHAQHPGTCRRRPARLDPVDAESYVRRCADCARHNTAVAADDCV